MDGELMMTGRRALVISVQRLSGIMGGATVFQERAAWKETRGGVDLSVFLCIDTTEASSHDQ